TSGGDAVLSLGTNCFCSMLVRPHASRVASRWRWMYFSWTAGSFGCTWVMFRTDSAVRNAIGSITSSATRAMMTARVRDDTAVGRRGGGVRGREGWHRGHLVGRWCRQACPPRAEDGRAEEEQADPDRVAQRRPDRGEPEDVEPDVVGEHRVVPPERLGVEEGE